MSADSLTRSPDSMDDPRQRLPQTTRNEVHMKQRTRQVHEAKVTLVMKSKAEQKLKFENLSRVWNQLA